MCFASCHKIPAGGQILIDSLFIKLFFRIPTNRNSFPEAALCLNLGLANFESGITVLFQHLSNKATHQKLNHLPGGLALGGFGSQKHCPNSTRNSLYTLY